MLTSSSLFARLRAFFLITIPASLNEPGSVSDRGSPAAPDRLLEDPSGLSSTAPWECC